MLVTSRPHFNVIRAPGTNISLLSFTQNLFPTKQRNYVFERYKRRPELENINTFFVAVVKKWACCIPGFRIRIRIRIRMDPH